MSIPSRLEGKGRLAIVAGNGNLPLHLAEAARSAGLDPVIIALSNEADQAFDGFEIARLGVGDVAGIEGFIREKGVDRVAMSGAVSRRPEWRDIHQTLRTVIQLPSLFRTVLSVGHSTRLPVGVKKRRNRIIE